MASELVGNLLAVALFLLGIAIVIVSVEAFIEAVAEAALALGVSGFFLTVVLAGVDLENVILGVAAAFDGLPDLALATVFGEALFILGAAVGVAGVLVPFEADVSRRYLGLVVLAPGLFFALALDGTLSRLDGAILTATFVPYLAIIYVLERRSQTRYMAAEEVEIEVPDAAGVEPAETELDGGVTAPERGDDEVRDRGESRDDDDDEVPDEDESDDDEWFDFDVDDFVESRVSEERQGAAFVAVAVVAAVGMTVGSEIAVSRARDMIRLLEVTGLVFGSTVMSFVASLEELFLTIEPIRQGRPNIGVGNVVGSMLFFVSANAGLIAMVRPLDTSGTVLTVHWPFFLVTLVVVMAAFLRGKVGRVTGAALLFAYVGYWGANWML